MNTDPDGWCTPAAGQDVEAFIAEFVACRPPLTGAEIAELRTVFRPAVAEAARRAVLEASTDAA
ncbi:hypothetical protein Sdia_23930 [Streptomyces diastaticus subsp. diastaticus]|uniref:Uncharacterized protein n=2 Tax=Streptomyces TaxID=1883 RepID=A0A385DIM1_9ACTN|nr:MULTISPECIES: hypothetical protein [Streptomyces]AXQ57789.1 hypothetical protein D0C37_26465 [Streptomyces koyangensis]MCQ9706154.1 hypothetical protein [Streptomyces sp. BSP1]GFH71625.1 hypothetical protein Sdia_23930 [Streptomyces diastaticus subsp. diastaticus]GGU13609.1 hypothetical protein GCM10015534_15480 [Streptomyces diastaticus subsp. diastaticus]